VVQFDFKLGELGMNKLDKQERKDWLNALKNKGGSVFSFNRQGSTIVVVPCAGDGSRFARVSIAHCDYKYDSFKRKRGEYIALERMFIKGESLAVPMLGRDAGTIAIQLAAVLDDTLMF
jgi:hypothetical protein